MIREDLSSIRSATLADRMAITHLMHFSPYVHLHTDWRAPIEWIGREPFLVLMRDGQPLGALACPPDPPGVAWLRLFVCQGHLPPKSTWNVLWPAARARLPSGTAVAVVGMHPWFLRLLEHSGFEEATRVVMLQWKPDHTLAPRSLPDGMVLRPMTPTDMPAVVAIDRAAFEPLWHYSDGTLREALAQAALATVVEGPEGVLGFQISTASPLGAHLARLAVHPRAQGQGIGTALVQDLLLYFQEHGAFQVTVNTQQSNVASLRLYQRLGFQRTENMYPVYLHKVP